MAPITASGSVARAAEEVVQVQGMVPESRQGSVENSRVLGFRI